MLIHGKWSNKIFKMGFYNNKLIIQWNHKSTIKMQQRILMHRTNTLS